MSEVDSSKTLRPQMPSAKSASLADTILESPAILTADDRKTLGEVSAHRRAVSAGAEWMRQDERADHIYFMEEGWACQFRTLRDGRRQILRVLPPGDVCNLDSLQTKNAPFGIKALTPVSTLSVARQHLSALCHGSPGIAYSVIELALCENAMLNQWATCLGRCSAPERLAHLLCELAVRLGHDAGCEYASFDLPLTQEQMADVLGLTAVHINRMMQQFRRQGLLHTEGRTITLENMGALKNMAEFDPAYLARAKQQVGNTRIHNSNGLQPDPTSVPSVL
ncbi:CRP-like cAMP-binding protein [Novosphingobium sp. PhB57]|nr:CRP-like cAMP-binding protein [Novosphingobium sp. PhB57]